MEIALDIFQKTHAETDNLLSYPDECSLTPEKMREFLVGLATDERSTEILAFIDGALVGSAGFEPVGEEEKVRRRAKFGISVRKAYWRLGIGRALMEACVDCAKRAGYGQLELEVLSENQPAIALYRSVGFVEFGRNPRGFLSRTAGWQELTLMRLELDF